MALKRSIPQVVQKVERDQAYRRTRRPRHTWSIRMTPYALTPFLIAPLLAGESVSGVEWQCRGLSDSLATTANIQGWYVETYLFLVPASLTSIGSQFKAAMVDPSLTVPADSTVRYGYYHQTTSYPCWTRECVRRVVEDHFREKGEAWDVATIDGYPIVPTPPIGWMHSLIASGDRQSVETPKLVVGVDDEITGEEVEDLMARYELYRSQGLLSEVTFEDYLRGQGVRVAEKPESETELIRYTREWVYPNNVVDPATGTAKAALSWISEGKAFKRRFCREPSFVLGCLCIRPKVIWTGQRMSATHVLDRLARWLPVQWYDDPRMRRVVVPSGTAPLNGSSVEYEFDVGDLFEYGDQFVNYDLATGSYFNQFGLPNSASKKKYVTQAMIETLFAVPASRFARVDGVASIQVLTHLPRDVSVQSAG